MQKKILISINGLLTLLLSANSFAYSGHGFKITSETIKSTPGFNFRVEETTPSNKNTFGTVGVQTADVTGYVRQHTQINGYHTISITNTTNRPQDYSYTVTLNCQDAQGYFVRNVTVQPNGSYNSSEHTYGDLQSMQPGSFRINATTLLAGESSAHHEAHATARIKG